MFPQHPRFTYKDKGWISYENYLGTKIITKENLKVLSEFKIFIKGLNINSNIRNKKNNSINQIL